MSPSAEVGSLERCNMKEGRSSDHAVQGTMILVAMSQNQCTRLRGSSALPSPAVVAAAVLEER